MPPSQHLWKKSSRIFRNDSGASFSIRYETVSTPVETLTFLMEAKARLSSVQVSGVLTARLSSGTGCVKVASISRRNCCLSAGRLSVSLASAKKKPPLVSCCLTSTEARWPIRDGDRVGRGRESDWLDRGNRPKKTGETVDRRQNNGSVKAVSPRHCPATCALCNCSFNCCAGQSH